MFLERNLHRLGLLRASATRDSQNIPRSPAPVPGQAHSLGKILTHKVPQLRCSQPFPRDTRDTWVWRHTKFTATQIDTQALQANGPEAEAQWNS